MGRAAVLLVAAVLGAGCQDVPVLPTPPVESPVPSPVTVSSVSPTAGWPFYSTYVFGSGFKSGARVTFGGLNALSLLVSLNGSRIEVSPPWREPGTVDVVVTNPDGSSAMLAGAFTYRTATLELSKSVADPGETLTVTWIGPHDPSDFAPPDVIGLYAVDDPLDTPIWWTPSAAGGRFSAQFKAPAKPDAYEVRYHMLSEYLLAKVPLTVR